MSLSKPYKRGTHLVDDVEDESPKREAETDGSHVMNVHITFNLQMKYILEIFYYLIIF